MRDANARLQKRKQLRRGTRPPLFQDEVVAILYANATDLANQVKPIEFFLDVEQGDIPRFGLGCKNGLQGVGCTAMPATGIDENDGQLTHGSPRGRCRPD